MSQYISIDGEIKLVEEVFSNIDACVNSKDVRVDRLEVNRNDSALYLFNYSNKYAIKVVSKEEEQSETKEINHARGLVLLKEKDSYSIMSRPFRRFYNASEEYLRGKSQRESYRIFDKLDGSLGILYWYYEFSRWIPKITTRGKFLSEQSNYANILLVEKYHDFIPILQKVSGIKNTFPYVDKTILFEIIYPENRIVVNYGNDRKLVYLATIDNVTGDVLYDDIGWPDTRHEYGFSVDQMIEENIFGSEVNEFGAADRTCYKVNKEGYVIRFNDGEMLKYKLQKYRDSHRFKFNVTPLKILRRINGDWVFLLRDILNSIDNGNIYWRSLSIIEKINECYEAIINHVMEKAHSCFSDYFRGKKRKKELADEIKEMAYPGIVFSYLKVCENEMIDLKSQIDAKKNLDKLVYKKIECELDFDFDLYCSDHLFNEKLSELSPVNLKIYKK